MKIYALGPGPIATTITAPIMGIPLGTGTEITGTFTEQTPMKELQGLLAVSDSNQGTQIEHLIQYSIDRPNIRIYKMFR
jgi:hypothetical protein